MNIFEKKLKEKVKKSPPIDPIKLYETCSCEEQYRYLRGIQEEVLSDWHAKRETRDVVCKMNTGSGKTLTGLLMLYSKLVEEVGKVLYVCPDEQLVDQAFQLGKQYGIPICVFEEKSRFPGDFLNQRKILICTFSKLFNGKSIFTREGIELGALLLDDAHSCLDKARDQTTVVINNSHELYRKFLNIFARDLEFQSFPKYREVESGVPEAVMRVPYWTWTENYKQIFNFLLGVKDSDDDNLKLKFKWDLVKDDLLNYDCFISGSKIEIAPIQVPTYQVPAFHNAKHRFILSATFEDDVDLIRDLSIDSESVLAPIVPKDRKDVGQRLIVAPRRYDKSLKDEDIRSFIKTTYVEKGENVVIIVPSGSKGEVWEELGAKYVDKENIKQAIEDLKQSSGNFLVLNNRYDGVDLAGKMCRILVLDGLPKYRSLREDYIERRLESLKHARIGQTIEQGLGRSVRSGADYSIVFLLGDSLTGFLGYEKNLQYFTSITKAQISLGLSLFDSESQTNSLREIADACDLCINQDEGWRNYHSQEIHNVDFEEKQNTRNDLIIRVKSECEAIDLFRKRKYDEATKAIKRIVDEDTTTLSAVEKAWYFQFAAQMKYPDDPYASNDLQIKAVDSSSLMLQPKLGHTFTKVSMVSNQATVVLGKLKEFTKGIDVVLHVESLLKDITYRPDGTRADSKKFEKAVCCLGDFLGFNSQLCEEELGCGPDILWCLPNAHFLIMEAKSNVTTRNISQSDIEQLLHSTEWFKKSYGISTYTPVLLHPSRISDKGVTPAEGTKVIDTQSLEELKQNVNAFIACFKSQSPGIFSEAEIFSRLKTYSLTPENFIPKFLKSIKTKK